MDTEYQSLCKLHTSQTPEELHSGKCASTKSTQAPWSPPPSLTSWPSDCHHIINPGPKPGENPYWYLCLDENGKKQTFDVDSSSLAVEVKIKDVPDWWKLGKSLGKLLWPSCLLQEHQQNQTRLCKIAGLCMVVITKITTNKTRPNVFHYFNFHHKLLEPQEEVSEQ